MLIRASELRKKEVINVNNGRRLGMITDYDILLPEGRIEAIIVPSSNMFGGFFRSCRPVTIPWCNIRKIGDDVIIVDLPKNYCRQLEEN